MSITAFDKRAAAVVSAERPRGAELSDLYRLYWPELCRYINKTFGTGPPEPEDVVQAAFMKFAVQQDWEKIKNPRAYLYRTAHNIAINELRKTATRNSYVRKFNYIAEDENLDDVHGERVLLAKERALVLEAAIKCLPRKQRRLLLLHRIHGLSYAEISRQTGISQTQVKRLVAYALLDCGAALRALDKGASGAGNDK